MLAATFPKLAKVKTAETPYKLLLKFFNYSERSRFLLELAGGAAYLKDFVMRYRTHYAKYAGAETTTPVILILDNDTGPKSASILNYVSKIDSAKIFPSALDVKKVEDIRQADFIHIFCNLYLVLTPLAAAGCQTDIEYFFKDKDRLKTYKGKCFNTLDKRDEKKDLSKDAFAKNIIKVQKSEVDFTGFQPLLIRITKVLEHSDKSK
jgi:RNA-directed DNA polymerase